MSAETYNKVRRILFSTVHNPSRGFSVAYEWLETTYKSQLGQAGYAGLKAELKFYEKHGREFNLTVAGDMGEHADFSGMFGRVPTRFDVTTNIDHKQFSTFEPYMGQGLSYKVALFDSVNFEVIDVLDLAFPQCQFCGGYEIPFVTLLNENYNRHGMPLAYNDQPTFSVCTDCQNLNELSRTTEFIQSPGEFYTANAIDGQDPEPQKSTYEYCLEQYKYFRRTYTDNLMGLASHNYKITSPDGDGYWCLDMHFRNSAVSDLMPFEIECGHEI